MRTAYDRLVDHFREHAFRFLQCDEQRSVTADFCSEVGTFRVVARVSEEDRLFHVFANLPIRIPEGARREVSEAMARANFGFKLGHFEMDWDDGELMFHASHLLSGGPATAEDGELGEPVDESAGEMASELAESGAGEASELLEEWVIVRLISVSLSMLDKYTPAFLSIVFANESARDAVARVEAPPA